VRVARIQIDYTFKTKYPGYESIVIEWGKTNRALNITEFRNPRNAWHLVKDGQTATGGPTFAEVHNVYEPDVYAVLSKGWLCNSGIVARMSPFDNAITEKRTDPLYVPLDFPGYAEADMAQKNFLYTILNDDDNLTPLTSDNTIPFLTNYEPWAYDRAMAIYIAYFKSGSFRFLREAVRNSEFYINNIYTPETAGGNDEAIGSFKLRNPDPSAWQDQKYSQSENILMTYWLTGDEKALAFVEYIQNVYENVSTDYYPGLSWTERHTGFKLLANVIAYEATGGLQYITRIKQIINELRKMQTSPYGGFSDGGLWHRGEDHDADEAATIDAITSPWMSELLLYAVERAYIVSEDTEIASLIIDLAKHIRDTGAYLSDKPWTDGKDRIYDFLLPYYLATTDGKGWTGTFDPAGDIEHSYDVASIAAWGAYFAQLIKKDSVLSASLLECADELYRTFSYTIDEWINPDNPSRRNADAYKVSPPRKYGWWFKNTGSFTWIMGQLKALPVSSTFRIRIANPINNAMYDLPADIEVNAIVSKITPASNVIIKRVELYLGSKKVAEKDIADSETGDRFTRLYKFSLSNISSGGYALTTKLVDSIEETAVSNMVIISAREGSTLPNTPSVVSITSPLSGAVYKTDGSIQIMADAKDADGSITKVEFYNGSTRLGQDTKAPYSYTITSLKSGIYVLTARATDNRGAVTTSVAVNIIVNPIPNVFPKVSITSPANGAVYTAGNSVLITANALDSDGSVAKVEFYNGSTKLGESTAAPYSYTITNISSGSYTLTAKATDNEGAVTTSGTVNITANTQSIPVTVAFQNGVNGYSGTKDVAITTLYASEAWNGGKGTTFNDVKMPCYKYSGSWEGRVLITFEGLNILSGKTITSAKLKLTFNNWDTGFTISGYYLQNSWNQSSVNWLQMNSGTNWSVPGGIGDIIAGKSFSIANFSGSGTEVKTIDLDTTVLQNGLNIILVTDNFDKFAEVYSCEETTIAYRPQLTVTYMDGGSVLPNNPPAVNLTVPANSANFTAPASITISASASDSDGSVTKIEFYQGAAKLGEDTVSPYSFIWSNINPGNYTLTAKATDDKGAETTSSAVNITVNDPNLPPAPPMASITSPANNAVFTEGTNITITANAAAASGDSIKQVEFFQEAASLGTVTATPYQVVWQNVPAGLYALKATATSNKNLSTTSSVINITINSTTPPPPVTGHPRLFITQNDIPRLRALAVSGNPYYEQGLKVRVQRALDNMNNGRVPNMDGGNAWVMYPTEIHAELFAFMSLVAPTQAERDNYAQRARTLLMYVINEAAKGQASGQPYRDPYFAVYDRSRWQGESFALTVDWIYPYLSAADKTTIRQVFLRWCNENVHAAVTGYPNFGHPEPFGVINDPVLTNDKTRVRWAANNYYAAHMRNILLMSLALDSSDDPGETLGAYLDNATGAWLYTIKYALDNEAKGGLPAEGFEYSPQAIGYVVQALLALKTAGKDDVTRYGPQVKLENYPYFNDCISGFLHSINPGKGKISSYEPEVGEVYDFANYGDVMNYRLPDHVGYFGPLGVYDIRAGNTKRLQDIRWIQEYTPTGSADKLLYRMEGTSEDFLSSIWYFMLFDLSAPKAQDPRPLLPNLDFFAPGIQRILSRTSWAADANWFTYKLGWSLIDHQNSDAGMFEFWRKGEWFIKELTSYGFKGGSTSYKNGLAIQNDPPNVGTSNYSWIQYLEGSQYMIVNDGDGKLLGYSMNPDYVYTAGDNTNLYNSNYRNSTDVRYVSRSIIWLKPDHIVIYDRAETNTAGRFKRFWLNFITSNVVINNKLTTVTNPSGQKLFVNTLLPTNAVLTTEPVGDLYSPEWGREHAQFDPVVSRLKVEASGGPVNTRFLHVLQGADSGVSADSVSLVQSIGGIAYEGAVVKNTVVLFPKDIIPQDVTSFSIVYTVPANVTKHYITGLKSNTDYSVNIESSGSNRTITITSGTGYKTDSGGVLVVKNM
jgi:hypothetical protein